MTRVGRRTVLGALGLAGAALPLAGCDLSPTREPKLLRSAARLPAPFTRPLPIPPVLRPASSDASGDHFEMTVAETPLRILPGLTTKVWAYGGSFPGPTLELTSGRPATLRQVNDLGHAFVTHLHGGRAPTASDGYPTDLVLPGRERTYAYPLAQRAATLWYHDHRMDHTGRQVWMGLLGMAIVRDAEERALPLPSGAREVPLVITDRSFGAGGDMTYPVRGDMTGMDDAMVKDAYGGGVLGDVILVNGAPWPELEVDAAKYRFRILNGSNARAYDLRLDPPAPFTQIGSDGGLLAAPVTHDRLRLAPATRFDVVVDFAAYPVGTLVTLRNTAAGGGPGRVMRFRVARKAADPATVPAKLSDVRPLTRADAVAHRAFRFRGGDVHGRNGWTVNGKAFDVHRVDATPRLGTTELWKLTSTERHPVHIHLNPFQVISRKGGDPGPYDAGWKDTVELAPGETVEVLMRFDGFRGTYVLHCHNLEHEDMAMMANFRVV